MNGILLLSALPELQQSRRRPLLIRVSGKEPPRTFSTPASKHWLEDSNLMEGQSNKSQSQHQYNSASAQWSRLVRRNTLATSTTSTTLPSPSPSTSPSILIQPPQVPTAIIETFPDLLPQQTSAFQDKLAHYNKFIASGRATRVHSSPLPPLLSTQHIQAVLRSDTSGYDNRQRRRRRSTSRGGHGNKQSYIIGNGERPLIAAEQNHVNMASKKSDVQKQLSRSQQQHNALTQQSSSVPSTPHQRARNFSTASRDPSPIPTTNHSPRSAYSESNSTFPPYRPLPSRLFRCPYETGMAHSRRRMPYKLGLDKLEEVKPSSIKAKLTADEEKKLTKDMEKLYDQLLPTAESETKRQRFVQKLENLLNTEWPGHDIRVNVFGSSGNLLCTDESDVDICITTEWKELERVCMLADLLARHGMTHVNCVSTAKVPIVKVWDPELGLACDMNVNNTLALENTRMIKTYVQIDPRVRPLAMIVKHWTRRRMVNDAAFGGTLSSYTWICMIINFLQLRNPPVLPALHQCQHQRLKPANGEESTFADDLDALRDFGKPNKQSLGDLLFQFFRFYGHEIDYDQYVISVRNGKLISKQEKGWHLANNNRLCVEEPFNVGRNLGNTADDFSFRGLHLELRRAFDLIAETKLDECCEQYVFPKEEERIWEKPPPAPRPAIISRSVSQSRGGRGGNNGARGRNTNHNRSEMSARRASSVTYDGNNGFPPAAVPQALTPNETWLQNQAQAHLHELYMNLEAQKDNLLRLQLYNQEQGYAQSQARMEAFAQAQRLQPNGPITAQHATDRSRGLSFDNAPLTAPLYYFYPMPFQGAPIYGQQSTSSPYPSSPSMPPAMPELRRSLHRSSVTSGSGPANAVPNSSMRSHSQPAARTALSPLAFQYAMHGMPPYQQIPQPNGISPHQSSPNDNGENGFDTESMKSNAESPPVGGLEKDYKGYGLNGSIIYQNPLESVAHAPVSTSPSRRRVSTEQYPQAILERLRRVSRSPSPLGRDRGYSAGNGSAVGAYGALPHSMSNGNVRALNEQSPLIVNGSYSIPVSRASAGPSSISGSSSDDQYHDALATSIDSLYLTPTGSTERSQLETVGLGVSVQPRNVSEETIMNLNGSPSRMTEMEAHPTLQAIGPSLGPIPTLRASRQSSSPEALSPGSVTPDPSSPNPRARGSRPQGGAVSPIDLGLQRSDSLRESISHLSPVYEIRSPSPTASRKLETRLNPHPPPPPHWTAESSRVLKATVDNVVQKPHAAPTGKANGHTRNSKSEGNGPGSWSQIPKWKKKGVANDAKGKLNGTQIHSEEVPRHESERKGG